MSNFITRAINFTFSSLLFFVALLCFLFTGGFLLFQNYGWAIGSFIAFLVLTGIAKAMEKRG